jgi:hypothetical protein
MLQSSQGSLEEWESTVSAKDLERGILYSLSLLVSRRSTRRNVGLDKSFAQVEHEGSDIDFEHKAHLSTGNFVRLALRYLVHDYTFAKKGTEDRYSALRYSGCNDEVQC